MKKGIQYKDALVALSTGCISVFLMYKWRGSFSWDWWMYAVGYVLTAATAFGKLTQCRAMKNLAEKKDEGSLSL